MILVEKYVVSASNVWDAKTNYKDNKNVGPSSVSIIYTAANENH